MRAAAEDALGRARAGGGPTLIEALTYRLADHTTADDARRYRGEDEVRQRWKEEPLVRLRAHLETAGVWDETREEALLAECRSEAEAAVEAYLATPPQPPESIFDSLHARLPDALAPQRAELLRREAGDG